MISVDDVLAVQETCLKGVHRWAPVGVRASDGWHQIEEERCLDCCEAKPKPAAPAAEQRSSVLVFPITPWTLH